MNVSTAREIAYCALGGAVNALYGWTGLAAYLLLLIAAAAVLGFARGMRNARERRTWRAQWIDEAVVDAGAAQHLPACERTWQDDSADVFCMGCSTGTASIRRIVFAGRSL